MDKHWLLVENSDQMYDLLRFCEEYDIRHTHGDLVPAERAYEYMYSDFVTFDFTCMTWHFSRSGEQYIGSIPDFIKEASGYLDAIARNPNYSFANIDLLLFGGETK